MACSGDIVSSGEPTQKISVASSSEFTCAIFARRLSAAQSTGVVVGEVRFSVSATMPDMSRPAMGAGTGMPSCW